MANGRFSFGTEVIAPASLAFIGNIDDSISEIVRSAKHDLFKPLPVEFDLAVIHRFHLYLPGWEIPSNADNLLTSQYGFITDYMAEAFHHLFKHRIYFSAVKKRARLSPGFQGRGEAIEVHCPESAGVEATLNPRKRQSPQAPPETSMAPAESAPSPAPAPRTAIIADTGTTAAVPAIAPAELKPKEFTIRYGDTGFSYRSIFGDYLRGAKKLVIEDPHVRRESQIQDLLQLCELAVEIGTIASVKISRYS